ncbi:MAG: Endo-1,4-beta-xylanase A precursor [Pelotomaculum sp. PtaB.Bin104]|nr:MAG: Endo-1,4-beta-xylanase A precursor [Pelotomaculum sp. PtaB.Bin104]
MRNILSLLLAVGLFLVVAAGAAAGELPGQGSFYRVQDRQSEIISEGVTLTSYSLTIGDRPVKLSVFQVDLSNPYVKLDVLTGADGSLEKTQTVSKMAIGAGAVAAVNGGFFIMGQGKPLGMVVQDGKMLSSPINRSDMPVFALGQDMRPLMDFFQFSGRVVAGNGSAFPLYGVNKLRYDLEDGGMSDTDHLTLYNQYWGQHSRGGYVELPGAIETVVKQGTVIEQVYAGEPLTIPNDGYILWGHGQAADFMTTSMPVGSKVQVSYQTTPAFEKIRLSTGSNSFLVQHGAVAEFQEELKGKNSRTAVATSDRGTVLYFVAVEKSDRSAGVEQGELAELLVDLGAETALNLDGGGSTTMVAKHLGETDLSDIIQPKEGSPRSVTDSIGIFNTAPPGHPAGIIVSGPDVVLAATSSNYSVKGFDSHYYPWQPQSITWRASGNGSMDNGVFTAGSGGDVVIEVFSEGVKGIKKVHVIGANEIKALKVVPAEIKVKDGQPVKLSFSIETKDGNAFPLEACYITFHTTTGTVSGGVFTPDQNSGGGILEANYQGLTVQVPVRAASLFKDTENNWANDQINDLAEAGIIKGYEDGTFRPAESVTRAQVVTLLARLLQWPPGEEQPDFKDSLPDWARDAVAFAVSHGVVRGYPDRTFQPNRPVTRAEVSVIIGNAVKLNSGTATLDFVDAAAVPAWARAAMGRVVSAGVLRGYEGNLLKPEANLTRAEMAVLISRLIGLNYVKVEG